jgi:CRISPR type IV-associated protein Csf2
MRTYLFEGVMTCLTSVSHIGDSHGVTSKLRREKFITRSGEVEEIPVISGNSLRGILRDRGMLHLLRTLGYGVNEETGEVRGLSLSAFYFLFSGGALTKIAGRGIDIDEARRWRELIPLVALFGGAMGNQIMPGKCKIGKAIPICEETAHLLPGRFVNGNGAMSIWEMVQEEAYTRRDDEKNENLRQLIAPEVRGLLEAKASAQREKSGTSEDVAGETGQKQQMRYFIETLAAGTELFWDITLDDVSPVEFDAFAITLAEFSKFPYIGGKSGVGHGKVSIKFDKWLELNPRIAPAGKEIDLPLGAHYMQHLERNGDKIREIINGLS